ncbi:carboxypeptidase regulatory-like domain-containing protein [Sphingobacterium sp. HJSM2_6]|uniref:carboxypeptidase regulatory-like domain-containing protein n=1 Tax=Sphingobacterium sp. HJSM2_6 TaxID=3366264 RepID=UPI003BC74D8B
MKKIAVLAVLLQISCSRNEIEPRHAFLVGEATDRSGNKLSGVQIIIDNSLLFNQHLSTITNEEGQYSLEIPVGSWYAFAKFSKHYHGQAYQLYLHPENTAGFGREGGKRNFTWMLTGQRPAPLTGNYGGLITFDHSVGTYIDESKIEVSLTPITPLIDGSMGKKITCNLLEEAVLHDIPLGRYRLQLSYEGKPLSLRKWNTQDPYQQEISFDFDPLVPGQCTNCFKIEYHN